MAATRIQAVERGRQTRSQLASQRTAAQTESDALRAREEKETMAATRIQAAERGRQARAELARGHVSVEPASPGRPGMLDVTLASEGSDPDVVEEETEVLAFSPVSSSPGETSPAYRGSRGATGFRAPPTPVSPLDDVRVSDEDSGSGNESAGSRQRSLDFESGPHS